MTKYKIIYNRKDCIGTFACVSISSKYWEMGEDGKANLIGSKLNEETNLFEIEVPESDFEEVLESAKVCPVDVIIIEKIEDSGQVTKIHPKQQNL